MQNEEVLKKLNDLIQLDIDVVNAYEQALEKIDNVNIKERLQAFQNDHGRHIERLSAIVETKGGTPPERSADFKGFLIKGFTALRSVTGTEGALKAMSSNESLTNSRYEKALDWDFDTETKKVIRENREDERKHKHYIDEAIQALDEGVQPESMDETRQTRTAP